MFFETGRKMKTLIKVAIVLIAITTGSTESIASNMMTMDELHALDHKNRIKQRVEEKDLLAHRDDPIYQHKAKAKKDKRERKRNTEKVLQRKRLSAQTPETYAEIRSMFSSQDSDESTEDRFPGKGHRLGGKKEVNHILGIDEQQAKKIRKHKKKKRLTD